MKTLEHFKIEVEQHHAIVRDPRRRAVGARIGAYRRLLARHSGNAILRHLDAIRIILNAVEDPVRARYNGIRPQPALFDLGDVYVTEAMRHMLKAADLDASPYLDRHARGDWGDVDDGQANTNALALRRGHRVTSCYRLPNGRRFQITTNLDHGCTTITLPIT